MRKPLCSLRVALLCATVPVLYAGPSLAQSEAALTITPPAVSSRNSAVFAPTASKQAASEPAASPEAAAKPGEPGKDPADPGAVEVFKLKHQIKTVRLSLAETQGRLAVTEKDLSAAGGENAQLRSDTSNLRVGLVKAETIAKKSEEELSLRRQEVKTLLSQRSSLGSGMLVIVMLLCLVTVGMLAVVLFGQGSKLRTILERMHTAPADDGRVEQLKAQLREEQQRSQRFEEERQRLQAAVESQRQQAAAESQRLQAAAESQANPPAGSKREKLDRLRRDLHQAQVAVEAEKRRADERIQKLEAEIARISADKQHADERVQELEPKMAELTAARQELADRVQKLEPEVARLAADKVEVEEHSRRLAHDAARLMSEKLRLEHALSKANEKLAFFGHDEPEDTLPPIVG